MNRQTIKSGILTLLVSLNVVGAGAQTPGNPLGVRGYHNWTMSVSYNYLQQQMTDGFNATARRQLVKVNWGAFQRLDLYVTAGQAKLFLKSKTPANISSYSDKYRFVYGAGVSGILKERSQRSPFEIWFDFQGLRFISKGNLDLYLPEGTGELTWKKDIEYDWRESHGYLGVTMPIHRILKLYLAGCIWSLQRIDTQKELWNEVWSSPQSSTYQSGLWTGGMLGLEIALPKQYSIGIEFVGFNQENYQIMVGICQTGN